jgi:lipid-A-disaccharide synthase
MSLKSIAAYYTAARRVLARAARGTVEQAIIRVVGRYLPGRTATVFISTGELSGEMHAAHLVRALQELRSEQGLPPAIIEGNGSKRMREAGVQLLFDVATWGEMGVLANVLKAQFLLRVVSATARYILSNQPDMVVMVDSRFLSTSLARYLRQRGYGGKIVYYVAPVRWQSLYDPGEQRRSLTNRRFLDVKEHFDFAIPIYPVSLPVYQALGIPHEYVGHPLCDLAGPILSDAQFSSLTGIDFDPARPPTIIGTLPGSRVGEVRQIAPVIFRALALMREAFAEDPQLPPLYMVSVLAHRELTDDLVAAARRANLPDLTLIDAEYVYDLMARARLMIVKSGTGIHECMLMNVPAIMCYRVTPFTAWFAQHIMRLNMPYFSLPNLLAGKPVVPELVQNECNHRRIVELASSLLYEERERAAMLEAYSELRDLVCKPAPLRRAAELLLGLLGEQR